MVQLSELVNYADALLATGRFSDYCPNGLQVEGRAAVKTLVSGVTACQALLEQAVANGADAIVVHHGYFWRGEDPRICGMKRKRIAFLLNHQVSLLAYHLPLDCHPEYGNNVQLARRLGIEPLAGFGGDGGPDVAMHGVLPESLAGAALAGRIAERLGRPPLHIAGSERPIKTVAWCTGAGQGYIEAAAALGVDAFITGEVSEQTVHIARETGLHFFAAGHHATERYGVQALAAHLAAQFGCGHQFLDIDNPV